MNTSNQTLSRNDIAAAVQRGEQLRQERIEQAARAREEAIRLLVNAAPQRADEILDRMHHLIVETVAGAAVGTPLAAGLVTEDGKVIYRIEDDIPVMLADEAIGTTQLSAFPD